MTLLLLASVAAIFAPASAVPTCADSPGRSGYSIAYDSRKHMVVLFGGADTAGQLSSALLGWNGTTWTCLAPSGPPARSDATLVYDEHRNTFVLYGGRAGREPFRDTWEFDGTAWKIVNRDGPTSEPHGVGAYDPATKSTLLFSGLGDDTPQRRTWRFADGQWTTASEQPQAEFPDAMLAGSASQPARLLSAKRTTTPDAFAAQMYEWETGKWSPVATTGETPMFSPQAPAARTSNGAILYAGFEADRSVATWILTGNVWRKYDGPSPPRRKGAQMAFDVARNVVVLHGGDDGSKVLNDTWEWNGTAWRKAY